MSNHPTDTTSARSGLNVVRFCAAISCLILFHLSGVEAHGQVMADSTPPDSRPVHTPPRLYTGVPYGSQAAYTPLTFLLNLAFEDQQRSSAERRLGSIPYRASFRGVWEALSSPHDAIDRYGGWREWVARELLPLRFGGDAAWAPNYSIHVVSGTLNVRMLHDWYSAHGVGAPWVWASVTHWGGAFLHEAMAHPGYSGGAGTLADLAIFDVAPMFLAHSDGFIRFLVDDLRASYWGSMASITVPEGEIDNMGEYWIYKIPLPQSSETRLFLRMGYGGQVGISRHLNTAHSLTLAYGYDTQERFVDVQTSQESVRLTPSWAVFWDQDDSLLLSLLVSERPRERVILNFFPGVLPGPLDRFGLWAAFGQEEARIGAMMRHVPGVGLGTSLAPGRR